jgi:hypothetical protein
MTPPAALLRMIMRRGCGTDMTGGRTCAVWRDGFFCSLTHTPSHGHEQLYFVDCKTIIKNNSLHARCDDASLPAAAKSCVEDVAKVRSMSFDGDPRVDIDE